jgi:hypothetical protein
MERPTPYPRRAPMAVSGQGDGMNGCSVTLDKGLNKGAGGASVSLDGMEDRSFG